MPPVRLLRGAAIGAVTGLAFGLAAIAVFALLAAFAGESESEGFGFMLLFALGAGLLGAVIGALAGAASVFVADLRSGSDGNAGSAKAVGAGAGALIAFAGAPGTSILFFPANLLIRLAFAAIFFAVMWFWMPAPQGTKSTVANASVETAGQTRQSTPKRYVFTAIAAVGGFFLAANLLGSIFSSGMSRSGAEIAALIVGIIGGSAAGWATWRAQSVKS